MVSKKKSRAAAANNAKKMKISPEEAVHLAPAETSTLVSESFLEFVSIKVEPVESPAGPERQSPIDPSPNLLSKKSGTRRANRSSVCELCLRKCPPMLVVQFSDDRGTNLADGLEKVEQSLQIQLEPKPFSVCRTCWQLVEIVATFRDGCLKARNLRSQDEGTFRDKDENGEWFSGKTSKAMEHALHIVQNNLDYFSRDLEGTQEPEDTHDESFVKNDEPNVKCEDDAADDSTESETKLDEYSKVTESLEITIEDNPEESVIKVDKAESGLPTELTPFPVYECTKCGRRFDSKNGLGVHVRRTEESPDAICKNSVPLQSPHCCTVCLLYFKSKGLLKCHMDKHLGTKTLVCRKGCGKMFYTGAMLRVHEHDCGTEQGKRLCPHCGLNFVTTSHLNRHMTQVHGEANVPCKICGKQFKTREATARHMNYSHSVENTLSCKLCDKKYKNPDSLRVHMRLHTNEMPYGCDICGKRFRYGHAVRPHMLREHGAGGAEIDDGATEDRDGGDNN